MVFQSIWKRGLELVVFGHGFPCSVWHGILWCFEMFFEIDFEMVSQNRFGKEMHGFCKDFGKYFLVFSVCGGPRGWRVVTPGLGNVTTFLGGRARHLG